MRNLNHVKITKVRRMITELLHFIRGACTGAPSGEWQWLFIRSDSNYRSFLSPFSLLLPHSWVCSASPHVRALSHKNLDMTLCFLAWPELLLFSSVRIIQTHTALAIPSDFLRPGLFECFRPHMALIMKQFLAWSLTSKIKDSHSLEFIPFWTLLPLIYASKCPLYLSKHVFTVLNLEIVRFCIWKLSDFTVCNSSNTLLPELSL